MLREINDARFVRQTLTPIGWRWAFCTGLKPVATARYRTRDVRRITELQQVMPVSFLSSKGRTCWAFEDGFYWTDPDCTEHDVLALVRERELRRARKLKRAHAALAGVGEPRRQAIPSDLRDAVWRRDAGRCVECESPEDLQFDHVIPVSMGGATSEANLQLLCGECNREKSDALA